MAAKTFDSDSPNLGQEAEVNSKEPDERTKTLKYHLLGPSLTKAGQEKVDQSKVSRTLLVLASEESVVMSHHTNE
jgi:hypothetical protein